MFRSIIWLYYQLSLFVSAAATMNCVLRSCALTGYFDFPLIVKPTPFFILKCRLSNVFMVKGRPHLKPIKYFSFLLSNEVNGPPYIIPKYREVAITKGDIKKLEKLKDTLRIIQILKGKGHNLPNKLSEDRLIELLDYTGYHRIKFCMELWYRWETSKKRGKVNNQTPLEEGKKSLTEIQTIEFSDHSKNSLCLPVGISWRHHFYATTTAMHMEFGQNVVFDCSYDQFMTDIFIKDTARQLSFSIRANMLDRRPFSFQFCNLSTESRLFHYLQKFRQNIGYDCPIEIHSCSYMDLYDRENIVYLSPHGLYDLEDYDPNDVYVIGAFVDKSDQLAVSSTRAREHNVRCARLPLEKFVKWRQGSKHLCIDHVLKILLTFKNSSGDWIKSLRTNLPSRKIIDKN